MRKTFLKRTAISFTMDYAFSIRGLIASFSMISHQKRGLFHRIIGLNLKKLKQNIFFFVTEHLMRLHKTAQFLLDLYMTYPMLLMSVQTLEKILSSLAGKNCLYVLASTTIDETMIVDNLMLYKLLKYEGDEMYSWRGNDESWDRLFDRAIEYFKTLSKQPLSMKGLSPDNRYTMGDELDLFLIESSDILYKKGSKRP